MTVLEVDRYPVDPSRVQEFEAMIDRRIDAMRAADGNLWADAARAADDPPSFLVLSEWRSAGDLDAFGAEADTDLDPLVRGEVSRRRFASAN